MGILKNLVTSLHQQTKRNYIERMQNEKVKCSKIAMKFEKNIGMAIESLAMEVINIFLGDGKM